MFAGTHLVLPGHVARVFDDHLHRLDAAPADGVKQRLVDALEAELVEQELDGLRVLVVDGEMEGATTHVVDTVDVECHLAVFEGLSQDGDIADGGRVQVHPLFVR